MQIELKTVAVTNQDFTDLVAELNDFFVGEWGEAAASYDHHHQLSAMKTAVVAYADGKAVGCGAWKLLDNQTPEVKRMFVKPTYRQFGIAQKILRHLEETMMTENYQRAVLETGAEMLGAIKFYEKNGYEIIPNYGEFIGDDRCVCLAKSFQ